MKIRAFPIELLNPVVLVFVSRIAAPSIGPELTSLWHALQLDLLNSRIGKPFPHGALLSEDLTAYLGAEWTRMTDKYRGCAALRHSADITAGGGLAPCHAFYDLVMGGLHEHTFDRLWNSERYRRFRAYYGYTRPHVYLPRLLHIVFGGRDLILLRKTLDSASD